MDERQQVPPNVNIAKILSDNLRQEECEVVHDLLSALVWDEGFAKHVTQYAHDLVTRIRKTKRKSGSLESFFQQYDLNTQEGLALMSMAEALLRIPDGKTANALIRDKISGTNWIQGSDFKEKDWMAKATSLGLTLGSGTMNSLFSKIGEPIIREAIGKAMRILGKQFVIGETMAGAMKVARKWEEKDQGSFRFSYDMLGEGARSRRDAQRYFESYRGALLDLAEHVKKDKADTVAGRSVYPGISVKLSALHPRYEVAQADICIPELTQKLSQLCQIAAPLNIGLTIDAEEVARLGLSLQIVKNICADTSFNGWEGFGLAVQAYHKAAPEVIDYAISLARQHDRKIQIRLVKGAYWDSEIKHAQIEGLEQYPVYTRKANTDLSYLRCAQKLMKNRDIIYPMFGTHNAFSVAAILDMDCRFKEDDKKCAEYEFQKLYGMGDALYAQVAKDHPDKTICVYAPVGPYSDLLPYLVRRMLENGANSSFVNKIYDKNIDVSAVICDPVQLVRQNEPKHHPDIALPVNLFGTARKNSCGMDLEDQAELEIIQTEIEGRFANKIYEAASLIGGKAQCHGAGYEKINPANKEDVLGRVYDATMEDVKKGFEISRQGHQVWSSTSVSIRANIFEKFADLMEENGSELMSLCIRDGGKTYADARDEIREAVDFCRYYAVCGRRDFLPEGTALTGPTGETNILKFESRGVFVCISPWNFPLAIFIGQVAAALMAGNAVIAKPAEQTSIVAYFAAHLMFEAGLPVEALTLLPGDGRIGAALVGHDDVAGVAFTGSTQVAHSIHKTLAHKQGPIVPLIAETGGLNAIVVDSSALTEQVVDDVVRSAFGSAGQRCSACRILFIQEEVADKTIKMLDGAMQELRVASPCHIHADIGPIIDEAAIVGLQHHKTRLAGLGKKVSETPMDVELKRQGNFFAPLAYELSDLDLLKEEVFGPILHIVRYKSREIDKVIDMLNNMGYGLTFGVHSRINSFIQDIASRMKVGNVYVNRSTIGAVVGVQPFGGRGLSGTGPKAGGPHYLRAYATEKVISTDTTAAGGNASLVMLQE